jgi:hypothetical protein
MKDNIMSEPITGTAVSVAGFKALGGAAGAASIGAVLATVVVMLMTLPKNGREWAVGIISTAVASLAGGAYVTIKLDLLRGITSATDDITLFFALVQLFGIVFACGLPGWALVRAAFLYMERNRDKDIGQVIDDVKAKI